MIYMKKKVSMRIFLLIYKKVIFICDSHIKITIIYIIILTVSIKITIIYIIIIYNFHLKSEIEIYKSFFFLCVCVCWIQKIIFCSIIIKK